jgi:hypothetical protein
MGAIAAPSLSKNLLLRIFRFGADARVQATQLMDTMTDALLTGCDAGSPSHIVNGCHNASLGRLDANLGNSACTQVYDIFARADVPKWTPLRPPSPSKHLLLRIFRFRCGYLAR